jgi:hypothetical protein
MKFDHDDRPVAGASDSDRSYDLPELKVLAWVLIGRALALAFGLTIANLASGAEGRPLLGLLPVYVEDRVTELAAAKRAQLAQVDAAVDAAVDATPVKHWPGTRHELKSMVLAWGDHETHYSLRIGRFQCKAYECDPDPKTKLPRSVSFWQLKVRTCSSPEAWEAAKTDFGVAAREATRAIVRARWQCRSLEHGNNWPKLVFAALTGRGCAGWLPGLEARVATYQRLVGGGGRQ